MGRQFSQGLIWKEATPNTIPTSPSCFKYRIESTDVKSEQRNETISLLGMGRGASRKAFGLFDVSGNQGFVWNTDNAPILLSLAIGAATSTANATSDSWAATTVYAKGDLVNHSDGLHTLVCYTAGTSGSTEPDLSAYTTAAAGRDERTPADGTVVWIIMPLLQEQSGERADCITSFGVELMDDNTCTTTDPDYCRYTGMYINSIPFSLAGDTISLKSSAAMVGMEEEDSIIVTDAGGTYEEMSAKSGYAETELYQDNWSLADLTYTFNGSASALQTSAFDMTINNNVTLDDVIETDQGKIPNFGIIDVSGSFTILLDKTLYAEAAGHAVKSSKHTFQKANGCLMEIELPQFVLEKTYKMYETAKSVSCQIPFSAFDSDALKSITWRTISPVAF